MIKRALLIVALTAGLLQAQVSFDRILHSDKEPQNWLTYSGSVNGQRYSPLTQITAGNAKSLELQWIWQAKSLEKYEATALVVDGVLYTVTGASPATPTTNDVVAMDGATGRIYWTYTYTNATFNACCGRVIRGLAILGDTLYMGTLDAHLLAIDAKTGKLIWNTTVADTASRCRQGSRTQCAGDHADGAGRNELVSAVIQSTDRTFLHSGLGEYRNDCDREFPAGHWRYAHGCADTRHE